MARPDQTPQTTPPPSAPKAHGETDPASETYDEADVAPVAAAEIDLAHEEPSPAAVLTVRRRAEPETVALAARVWRAAHLFIRSPNPLRRKP